MIISSYRFKPYQYNYSKKKRISPEYQGWTTRDAEIPWAGSLRRISRGWFSSVEFYFRRELCRVFVVSAADRKRSCRGLRANTNLLSRGTFTAAVQVPSVAPPPSPLSSTSKFPSGVPDYNLNRLRFLVSLETGEKGGRVVPSNCHYCLYLIGYFRLVCAMEFGIWNFRNEFPIVNVRNRSWDESFVCLSRSFLVQFDISKLNISNIFNEIVLFRNNYG